MYKNGGNVTFLVKSMAGANVKQTIKCKVYG